MKKLTLLLNTFLIMTVCFIVFRSQAYAATNKIDLVKDSSSNNKVNVAIDVGREHNTSVASFNIKLLLDYDEEIVSDVSFELDSKLKGLLEEYTYSSDKELNIYFVGVSELTELYEDTINVGSIVFDIDKATSVKVKVVGATLSSIDHLSTNIAEQSNSSFSLKLNSSSSSSTKKKAVYGKLEKESYMAINSELDGLAISLRSEPYETKNKVNKNIYALDEKVTYYIDFKNGGKDITNDIEIVLELPLAFSATTSSGASISTKKHTLTWKLPGGLEKNESGTIEVTVKYKDLNSSSDTYKKAIPVASILVNGKEKDSSAVLNLIIKDYNTTIKENHEPYMRGDIEGTFRPDATISRAEVAIVLTRVFGIDTTNSSTTKFSDINETYDEAQRAIAAASEKGLIQGYPDGTYKPNEPMTRAEFLTILARQVGNEYGDDFIVKDENELIKIYKNIEGTTEEDHWAGIYISLLARLNMTTLSDTNKSLMINQSITRAEVTQFINYYLLRTPITPAANIASGFTDVYTDHSLFGDIVEATRQAHNCKFNDKIEEL